MGTPQCVTTHLVLTSLLLVLLHINVVFAQTGRSPAKPPRIVTITGQVSLPNGRPADGVIVRLSTRSGIPREVFTNDSGRFEFNGMDEGGYVLTAKSLKDVSLVSDAVQTDTSNTVTGNLTVNLILREAVTSETKKAGVIRVEEIDQRIPKNARKAFDEGLKFKQRGEPEKALNDFNRAIELYPEYYQALTEKGDLFVYRKNLEEAGTNFDLALKFNSHYGPALRGAGYCSLEKANYEEAITRFEQALLADPDNASTHLLLGIANLQLNRLEAARASLTKALSFNQPPLRAHVHLANLYAKEHLYQQAIDELKIYLALEIDIPDRADLEAIQVKWRALLVSP